MEEVYVDRIERRDEGVGIGRMGVVDVEVEVWMLGFGWC